MATVSSLLHFQAEFQQLDKTARSDNKPGQKARVFLKLLSILDSSHDATERVFVEGDYDSEVIRSQLSHWHALLKAVAMVLESEKREQPVLAHEVRGHPRLAALSQQLYECLIGRAGLLLDLGLVLGAS